MAAPSAIPGLKKLPKPDGFFTWYWAASQISRKADAFRPKTVRLWHGKGQPSQSNSVSHGCPPARFKNVTIVNTGREA